MNISSCTALVTQKQFAFALPTIQMVVNDPEAFITMYTTMNAEQQLVTRRDICTILTELRKQQFFASKREQGWSDQDAKSGYYLLRNFVQIMIRRQVFGIDQCSLVQLAQLLCPSIGEENNLLLTRIHVRLTTPEGKKEFEAAKSEIIHALDALYRQAEGAVRDRAWSVLETSPWTLHDREDLSSEITSLCL